MAKVNALGDPIIHKPKNESLIGSMSYVLVGDPIPLNRPRMSNSQVFDSQKRVKFGSAVQLAKQHAGNPLFNGSLTMDITFYFYIPKTRRSTSIGSPHYIKPDLDNLIKYVCDVANGIIYVDDALIYCINAKKVYDITARTEFTVTRL